MAHVYDVIVVGLGAAGSACLYQLASRRMDVLGVDRFHPPHNRGSSHGESRITRESVSEGPEYVPFVLRSHQLWREFEQRTGRTLFEQVGALFMAPAGRDIRSHGGHFVERALSIARECNIDHRRLTQVELAREFPQFKLNADMVAYHEKGGGFVRPEACIEAQLQLAVEAGAQTRFGVAVLELASELRGVRVVTDAGDFHATRVVLAAGAWLPELAGGPYRNLKVTRQVLLWFRVTDPSLWDKSRCPVFIYLDGSAVNDFIYGFPMVGPEHRIKVASETEAAYTGELLNVPLVEDVEIDWICERHVVSKLNGVSKVGVEAKTCLYTQVPFFQFLIDHHPSIAGVMVVSPCSGHGFKHSAALGEAIAEKLVGERASSKLAAFSIARLQNRLGAW